ncbi:MAG TPA: MBL fold metallo-hydrolase [Solirubrobacteraceae bacterium]|nr:MBL fold metallo-hydrolase [Solirubrobacteraceae bacterium]
MRLRVWGARGSIPAPGPETTRYGGNTSCVQVELSDGSTLVLDAGTGIRPLGLALPRDDRPLHILLTHLHLDHIQGLMFFAPMFRPGAEIVIYGPCDPGCPESSLRSRIGRYLSAPLAPVEIRELPCDVSFQEAETTEWEIGPARIRAASVTHRGPTLGYRISDGGRSIAYIPDHEPGLGTPLQELEDEWMSGLELARGADLLLHDAQYTDEEYPRHLGWGHSPMADALTFARRAAVGSLVGFHHDPMHSDDQLDAMAAAGGAAWVARGGEPGGFALAGEGMAIDLAAGAANGARPSLRPAPAAAPDALLFDGGL